MLRDVSLRVTRQQHFRALRRPLHILKRLVAENFEPADEEPADEGTVDDE